MADQSDFEKDEEWMDATNAKQKAPTTSKDDTLPRGPKRLLSSMSPQKPVKRYRKDVAYPPIQTFIFLDLETTGLITCKSRVPEGRQTHPAHFHQRLHQLIMETRDDELPRITELSLVSIQRDALLNAIGRMRDKNEIGGQMNTPVACNVHTRQINPCLSAAEWQRYSSIRRPEFARLNQPILEQKNTFAEEWAGVRHLLDVVPKPACLLAHNGLGFDLRVLYGELKRANLLQDWAPEGIHFADTLYAFRHIDSHHMQQIHLTTTMVDWSAVGSVRAEESEENEKEGEGNGDEDAFTPPVDRGMVTPQKTAKQEDTVSPSKRTRVRALFPAASLRDDHPLHFLDITTWTPARAKRLQAKFFRKMEEKWSYDVAGAQEYAKKQNLYKLENLYDSIFGGVFDAHQAQDDCEALLQVALSYGKDFVDYVDTMSADFPF